MKKIIRIFIMMLLIATTFSPVVNCIRNDTKIVDEVFIDNNINKCYMDELDQYQNQSESWSVLYQISGEPLKSVFIQSFKPSYPTLTSVSVLLNRYRDPFLENGKLQVVIKSELDPGHWMTSVDLTESDIPEGENWIYADLDDIKVEPERIYYLLLKPVDIKFEGFNTLYWGYSDTYPTDLYTRGDAYFNYGNPNEFEIYFYDWKKVDMCFKTYGIPNTPPNNPVCYYERDTDELVITGFDPDDDNIRYGVSWNDNMVVDTWTEYVVPGTEKRIDCEKRKNPVGVISEDIYGDQSQWSSVTPKIRSLNVFNPWITRLIERFPILELII